MRKKLILIVTILFALASAIILLVGIWKNNNSVKIVGFALMIIIGLGNFIRGVGRWDRSK